MKNYKNSDYAANKYSNGIVYKFADKIAEVTLADYIRENPDRTEADFAELKALSDELYLEQVRNDHRQMRKNLSFDEIEHMELYTVPSPEEETILSENKMQQREIAKKALSMLTEIQKRRYLLYTVKRLNLRQIAEIEGVNHSKVQESLLMAEKKIKTFCEQTKKGGTKHA